MSLNRAKPYIIVILLQFGLAGMAIIAKYALNQGMNHYAFVVYRHTVATIVISPFALLLERNVRPRMTLSIFLKILLLGLLEPVMDQNLFYAGMKYTTATFVTAMSNIVPALTFLLAWASRLEQVNLKRIHSLAKLVGTLVTVGGATIMTLVKGPVLNMPRSQPETTLPRSVRTDNNGNSIKGACMVAAGCICWAAFVILQAMTLKSYPAEMSLTALICLAGALEGALVALIMERHNTSIWWLHRNSIFLAYIYSGIICSGIALYVQGMIMKQKGPVFVTTFNPLSMIIVAILGSFILAEKLTLGRIIGAVVIVIGLYLVIWGKMKDQKTPLDDTELIPPIELQNAVERITSHTSVTTNQGRRN